MPNLMRRHMKRLDDVARQVMRETVSYSRKGRQVSVLATIGQSEHLLVGNDDVMTSYRTVDFIITAADIKEFGDPQRDDVIISDHDGEMREYVLSPVGENENVFKRSDEFGIAYRIHTTPSAKNGQHS